MNLQFKSLRAHIDTGAEYDDSDPIVRNVIFDISAAKNKISHQIIKDVLRHKEICKDIKSYKTKNPINVNKYMFIVDRLSGRLFDDFSVDNVTSERQAEWKEYFHSLYELVVVDYSEICDKTTQSIIINETYKYWNLLDKPKKLKPTNKLYALVGSIQDLFEDLKVEHEKYTDQYFVDTIMDTCVNNINKRKEAIRIKNAISEKEDILRIYEEILQWAQ
jgi:hypothetical protein